jgi:cation diffusion facilitator CzcD-associated flavoprotein CzcO
VAASACLIGAGASGIAAARALDARAIEFDWFDKGDRVGGIWVLDSASGLSSAYRQLHINVSRERLQFADRPMSSALPIYPRHTQIVEYFEDYVSHFGLDRRLRLETAVASARRRAGGWEVVLDDGERRRYDALVVANGHHSEPRGPEPAPAGEFDGEQLHSHDYRDDSVLRGRDVVVVGLGNSACDIAVEASRVARSCSLSARRGAHVLPKSMWRWPYDQVPGLRLAQGGGIGVAGIGLQLPWRLRQRWLETGQRLTVGRMSGYGLPEPGHRFGAVHPTISPRLLDCLLYGDVAPRPEIRRLDGDLVHFADGSAVPADLIVWCTGYAIRFPFLHPEVSPVGDGNRVELYWGVFSPEVDGLAFVGLVQPAAGSTMQIAEAQGSWVAAQLAGEYALPPHASMVAEIARRRRRDRRRVLSTPRHTVQIEQFDYTWRLQRELRRGRRRARAERPAAWIG